MRYRKLFLIILLIILVIVLFAFGIGFFIAFIKDKIGDNFLWITMAILVVLSLLYLVRYELKSKKEWVRKKSQYFELGQLLFNNYILDFEAFYNSYLQTHSDGSSKSIRPIEALYEFAVKKGLLLIADWKGEENEGEIQDFISAQIETTISWTCTNKIREKNTDNVARDGKFIIRLFKAIDKDLKEINKKLIFFNLGADSYIFALTDITTFKDIIKFKSGDFHGTEKLKT